MLEISLGILFGIMIGSAVRILCKLKISTLEMSGKYRSKFYELAGEAVNWPDLSDRRLARLSIMSAAMKNRKAQFWAIQSLKEVRRDEAEGKLATDERIADAEHRRKWLSLTVSFLVAVCAQGTIVGYHALLELLKTIDPEKPPANTEVVIFKTGSPLTRNPLVSPA